MTTTTKDENQSITPKYIRSVAEHLAAQEYAALQELEGIYWELHQEILDSRYTSRWDQLQALEKLSELGLALKAKSESYSAINKVRCI